MKKTLLLILLLFIAKINYAQQDSFQGEYKSIKGTMDPLSCFCYNGGYFTYGEDEVIPLCCDKIKIEIPEERIIINGKWETLTNNPEPSNPCPKGKKGVFVVEYFSMLSDAIKWEKDWETKFGNTITILKLEIATGAVRGEYDYKEGKIDGFLTRTTKGTSIEGTWEQSDGKGWFIFNMKEGEENFTGEWGYTGKKKAGTWNATRVVNEAK